MREWNADAGERLMLGVIVFAAAALRIYGIEFGLPLHYHIDETRIMDRVMVMVTTGDLNPHFFNYPSFLFYFISALVLAYYALHFVPFALGNLFEGRIPSPSAFREAFQANDATLYLLARTSIAVFGILTVVLVYFLAKRLRFSKNAALFSALGVALMPLHVIESHYIKQEVPMTFFMLLAFFLAVRGEDSSRRRASTFAALAAGAAASVKYNGILALTVLPALFRREGRFRLSSFFGWPVIRAVLIAVGTFLLITPFAVLDSGQFVKDVGFELFHVAEMGHHAFDLNGEGIVFHRFLYQILAAYPFSLGIPLYLLSLAGLGCAIGRREPGFLWILFFALPYFLLTASMKVVFLRYSLPVAVILCMAAGYGISALGEGAPGRIGKWAVRAAAVLVVVYTASFTWTIVRHMPRGNTTLDDALSWLDRNAPPGSRVARTLFTPPLSGRPYEVTIMRPHHFRSEWLEAERPDVIVASALVTVGFERGGTGMEGGREFLEDLRSQRGDYRRVAKFERDFLQKDLFERIDPILSETFMPAVEIFARYGCPARDAGAENRRSRLRRHDLHSRSQAEFLRVFPPGSTLTVMYSRGGIGSVAGEEWGTGGPAGFPVRSGSY